MMKSGVSLDWKAAGPRAMPMKLEAGSLAYREANSDISLTPWGKLTRGNTVVEGENAIIALEDGKKGQKLIRKINASKARGSDVYPRRKLEYAADQLWVDLNDEGEVQKIIAQTNARLQMTSDVSETTVTANHVEMHFDTANGESVLSTRQRHRRCRGHVQAAGGCEPAARGNSHSPQQCARYEDAAGRP